MHDTHDRPARRLPRGSWTLALAGFALAASAHAQDAAPEAGPAAAPEAASAPAAAADSGVLPDVTPTPEPAAEPAAAAPSEATATVDTSAPKPPEVVYTPPAKRLDSRWYVAPLGSFALTDGGRNTKNEYGGAVAVGYSLSGEFAVELAGGYSKLKPANAYSIVANLLFFPTQKSFYTLIGAGYGRFRDHPGANGDYQSLLFNLGAGYLWGTVRVFGQDLMIRTEGFYRLDAHSTARTGNSIGNGRRSFNEGVVRIGFVLPFGEGKAPPTPPAEVPAESPQVVPADAAPASP